MNKRQKLVQEQFLNDEEKVIKRLKTVYNQSYKDITGKIKTLDSSIADLQKALADVGEDEIGDIAAAFLKGKPHITPDEAKATLQSMIQSKVYQKNYQKALQKQVDDVLGKMLDKEFTTVSEYINECYENGFIGTMFDLQGQGIPMCFPLDQEAMVRAVQLDSKISQGLYTKLGEDVTLLKRKITAQVSRGISTGMSYQQVAQQLAGYTSIGFNNAVRIARTEGHRVQVQSAMDACYKAKDKGADIVKQWDAAMDKRTRESHAMVDGEIRELDKPFSNGLMFPGDPAGGAGEVVNCRCALLQRARWALDEDELQTLKDRAAYFGLDKTDTFEEYKKKYLKAADSFDPVLTKSENGGKMTAKFKPASTIDEAREYAQNVLGLDVSYDYNQANIDVANAINKEITRAYDEFGNLHDAGVLDGIFVANGKQQNYAAYQRSSKQLIVHKSTISKKSSLATMAKDAKEQFEYGFWSTGDAEHSIRHEIGHAVDFALVRNNGTANNPRIDAIKKLFAEVTNKCGVTEWSLEDSDEHTMAAGDILSYYALRDDREFVAESVAEYMGGNPRSTAKEIIRILKGV